MKAAIFTVLLFCLISNLAHAKACEYNDSNCNYNHTLYNLVNEIDIPESINDMINLSKNGDLRAAFILGIININEGYKNKNFSKSKDFFSRAASNGDILSKAFLTIIRMEEHPQPTTFEEITLFANDGVLYAQIYLGRLYTYGLHGISEDREKAAYWFERAAQQGSFHAANYLAWLYYSMDEKSLNNLERAMIWYDFAYSESSSCEKICTDIINPIIMNANFFIPDSWTINFIESSPEAEQHGRSPIAIQIRYTPKYHQRNMKYLRNNIKPERLDIYKCFNIL